MKEIEYMRNAALYIALFLIFAVMPTAALADHHAQPAQAEFFTTIRDMPLMPGLSEIPDQTVSFDKPEGRIVEAIAALGSANPETVRDYYDNALPRLGWQNAADGAFIRGQERLQLSFEVFEGQHFLRVMVQPR